MSLGVSERCQCIRTACSGGTELVDMLVQKSLQLGRSESIRGGQMGGRSESIRGEVCPWSTKASKCGIEYRYRHGWRLE